MNAFAGAAAAQGEAPAARAVRRATAELRRGVPIVMEDAAGEALVAIAAETLDEASLAEFARASTGAVLLVLDAGRAAHWRRGEAPEMAAVAVPIAPGLLQPALLRGIADPTAPQLLEESPAPVATPPGAAAALLLAKQARLLPAMLVASAGPLVGSDLLHVDAAAVLDRAATDETRLVRVSQARVPLQDAPDCRVVAFRGRDAGPEHLAVVVGSPESVPATERAPLARIHSECFTGDLLGSLRCDCGPQLRGALRRMAEEGAGVVLYLAQEGRGIGLANKLRAYALQDSGLDTLDANRALGWGGDERDFAAAAAMLRALDVSRVRLLTNNPRKLAALAAGGIAVERVSHLFAANGLNDAYLATKTARFGHLAD